MNNNIKLTGLSSGKPIYLPITSILKYTGDETEGATVYLIDGSHFYARESAEEIYQMIEEINDRFPTAIFPEIVKINQSLEHIANAIARLNL